MWSRIRPTAATHHPWSLPFLAALLLLLAACNKTPLEERPDAPGTPEEQLEALEAAADEAVKERNFARAEVALETLVELEKEDGDSAASKKHRARLSIVRKRRKADQILREVEHLIELKAFRTARVRLDYLENRRLHEDDAEQVTLLRELLEIAKQEEAGIDLPE